MATSDATEGTKTERGPVLPNCNDAGAQGHWHCVTHGEDFLHNFAMNSHTERGNHVLAWVCHTHGPEVP